MDQAMQQRWNQRYREATVGQGMPARVLAEHLHLLPASGRALDLAAGLGANSIALARAGLSVEAWDIASAAMSKLAEYAQAQGLNIRPRVCDVLAAPPPPASFDVVIVSRFLERGLAQPLMQALRPGGLLFYQTFTQQRVGGGGPDNAAFRLAPNELLSLFTPLRLVLYREEGRIGRLSEGFRNEAMLIAQRPDDR